MTDFIILPNKRIDINDIQDVYVVYPIERDDCSLIRVIYQLENEKVYSHIHYPNSDDNFPFSFEHMITKKEFIQNFKKALKHCNYPNSETILNLETIIDYKFPNVDS